MARTRITYWPLDPMPSTPFGDGGDPRGPRYLEDNGIVRAASRRRADLLVTQFVPRPVSQLRGAVRRLRWQPVLVWTHEPRYAAESRPRLRPWGVLPPVHVMNVHTGDVFVSNVAIFGAWVIRGRLPAPGPAAAARHRDGRHTVFLGTYYESPERLAFPVGGRDLSLIAARQRLAVHGYEAGRVDVYGKGWPPGVSREDSRDGDWHGRKLDLLRPYRFNLCPENTNVPRYCTEKIWDSIAAGCLPIYHGAGNAIHEDFPPDSFVDCAGTPSPGALFDRLDAMPVDEYVERLGRCTDVYNRLATAGDPDRDYVRVLENLVARVRAAVG